MVWYDTVWYGVVWYRLAWYGMVWYGIESGRIGSYEINSYQTEPSVATVLEVAGTQYVMRFATSYFQRGAFPSEKLNMAESLFGVATPTRRERGSVRDILCIRKTRNMKTLQPWRTHPSSRCFTSSRAY